VRKQQHIDRIIQEFINNLQNAASDGKTSYMYSPDNLRVLNQYPSLPVIANDDPCVRFPEC
jgi:hypothetical protein